MKKNRIKDKQSNALKRLKGPAQGVMTGVNIDYAILDLVMQFLYNHPEKEVLNLEEEIYKPNNIVLTKKVSERVWESLKTSGMIAPLIGFGNSGKIELTNVGMQLMNQYGSYANFLQTQPLQAGAAVAPSSSVALTPNKEEPPKDH